MSYIFTKIGLMYFMYINLEIKKRGIKNTMYYKSPLNKILTIIDSSVISLEDNKKVRYLKKDYQGIVAKIKNSEKAKLLYIACFPSVILLIKFNKELYFLFCPFYRNNFTAFLGTL